MTRRDALVVGAAGCTVLALALVVLVHRGVAGISHDDAARTLLAADFARAPSVDPTRSSWLPVPTYVLGLLLRLVPRLSLVPRALSVVSGMAVCALAAGLSRAAGARTLGALGAVTMAAAWRWSVLASLAPGVPEMPATALVLGATWLLAVKQRPWSAGVLLSLACGCRYEAWFATPALLTAWALASGDRRGAVRAGLVALVVPVAWLAINHGRHGDALEFVHRVARFRRAEGLAPWGQRVGLYPRALVREAGVLVALAAVGLSRRPGAKLAAVCVAPAAVVLAALVWTESRGGGASHHPARALLPVVWWLVPAAARGLDALWDSTPVGRWLAVGLLAVAWGSVAVGHPERVSSVDPMAVAAGHTVKARLVQRPGSRWGVDLSRQDFLWVELASGSPAQCVPDRAYGTPQPDDQHLDAVMRTVNVAAVCSDADERAARAAGLTDCETVGPWQVCVRPVR